jgi:hypothetical protein
MVKFCRSLQRVIDVTEQPEWAPFWTNYKMLKKFLKALVPPDAAESTTVGGEVARAESPTSDVTVSSISGHGDVHENEGGNENDASDDKRGAPSSAQQEMNNGEKKGESTTDTPRIVAADVASSAAEMKRSPGEIAFFKLLNLELKKAINFFDNAQLEFEIREARVREGIDIMRQANRLMVEEKWTLMERSLYKLYKDMLLLELYAIMTYCSFSKILKKHDKVTKHTTRTQFMKNVVNKANFTNYPKLSAMITRCEVLYDEISQSLIQAGKSGLYEDERLFINMIHRLNDQVLDSAEAEGAPDVEGRKEKKRSFDNSTHSVTTSSHGLSVPVATLYSLVQENALNKRSKEGKALVAESEQAADGQDDQKCPATDAAEAGMDEPNSKRARRSS